MKYEEFKQQLNLQIFGEDLHYDILTTVIKNPHRYIGLFRITNAKTKLIQNLTQSCEIKFGNFIEDILTQYLSEMGYRNLDKNLGVNENGELLKIDQIFQKDKEPIIYMIEQKIRDDHDSTKKRGQYANLIKKIKLVKQKFPNHTIKATMWFSDDSLKKNRRYYLEQIQNNTDDVVEISLFYGKELFETLFNKPDIWEELITHLKQNKQERCNEILNVPDFDTSVEIRNALLKLKQNDSNLLSKLLSDKQEYIELRKELFPTGKNLENLQ